MAMLDITWYEQQLVHIGNGKPTKMNMSAWASALKNLIFAGCFHFSDDGAESRKPMPCKKPDNFFTPKKAVSLHHNSLGNQVNWLMRHMNVPLLISDTSL